MQKWKIKGLKILWELERFTDIKEPKELQRNLNVYKWIGNMEVKDLQQIKKCGNRGTSPFADHLGHLDFRRPELEGFFFCQSGKLNSDLLHAKRLLHDRLFCPLYTRYHHSVTTTWSSIIALQKNKILK